MGYAIGDTAGGHATVQQRATRLGQAMDGNTMRWLSAFLYAQQQRTDKEDVQPTGIKSSTGFTKYHNRVSNYFKKDVAPKLDNGDDPDPRHQACAIIEKILQSELPFPNKSLGGGDRQNPKRKRTNVQEEITTPQNTWEGKTPGNTPDRDKPTFITKKWKIGGGTQRTRPIKCAEDIVR